MDSQERSERENEARAAVERDHTKGGGRKCDRKKARCVRAFKGLRHRAECETKLSMDESGQTGSSVLNRGP